MYINKKKSWFETQKVDFLEYVIQLSEITQNSQKTKIVINWLRFTKIKKVQTFLNLMNYYWWYVTQHSHTAEFLTYFMCKNKEFHWEAKQEKIFEDLKARLMKMTQLWILWLKCDKKIEINASDFVIDSSLYQIKKDQQKSIIFWSWKLTESEKQYKIHNKKLLIIVKLLKKWRVYLEDIRKSVKIYMNHKNLWNFATTKQLNQQQICWIKQLTDFEFEIHYKKNNENSSINMLS